MDLTDIELVEIIETCMACPSQWDAYDKDGNYYYIRYRWGYLSVDKGAVLGEPLFGQQVGGSYDGTMSIKEMLHWTGLTFKSTS